jgi:hypothetical protein
MKLAGLDLNATRLRAVQGSAGAPPRPLALDGAHRDLPVALSLEGRHPEVGRPGLALCRRLPHLACLNILPYLGDRREWIAGRHRLDAARALTLVFERVQPALAGARGLALAVPGYVTAAQVAALAPLLEKLKILALGSITAPLAAALAAYREQPWLGPALVLDADDQALTLTLLTADEEQARVLAEKTLPGLDLRAWTEGVLNAVADRCVRHSRRDPRDSATTEQSLYEQIETGLDVWRQGQMVELVIQASSWFQNLILRPEEIAAFCGRLARQTTDGIQSLVAQMEHEPPRRLIVTDAVARLPGLVPALHRYAGEPAVRAVPPAELESEDGGSGHVVLLAADAVSGMAYELADRFHSGDLPRTHLDAVAPLPVPQPVAEGPARLHFRGQDHPLRGQTFTVGRQAGCDLVFDAEQYPTVSARHCEIAFDHRHYVVRDRSRNGTLLNDRPVIQQAVLRPGDWIRLGPDGPVLRFLGQVDPERRLGTIA